MLVVSDKSEKRAPRKGRATLSRTIKGEPPRKGGILAALRRSPLVGVELKVARRVPHSRKIDP